MYRYVAATQKKLATRAWALLPLRFVAGFGFVAHGYAKLSRGPERFAVLLSALGVSHPTFMSWATALLEIIGGLCVMAGAFVTLFSIPLVAVMLTAMFSVHLRYGFSSVRLQSITASGAQFGPIGYELNLLYIAALITLALSEPGELSVDYYLLRKRNRKNEPE